MSFGLINTPGTFMNLMKTIFKQNIGVFAFVVQVDRLVVFKTEEDPKEYLEKVFKIMRRCKLYSKIRK